MKTFTRIISFIVILLFAIVTIVILGVKSETVFLTWACVAGLWVITIYLDLIKERDLKGGYR